MYHAKYSRGIPTAPVAPDPKGPVVPKGPATKTWLGGSGPPSVAGDDLTSVYSGGGTVPLPEQAGVSGEGVCHPGGQMTEIDPGVIFNNFGNYSNSFRKCEIL